MKKTLFLLLALTALTWLAAQPVGIEKAQAVAKNFISINKPHISNNAVSGLPSHIYYDDSNSPVLYAFNIGNNGFILVGADKSFSPIIGYSLNGTFDDEQLPDNLKSWLSGYVEDVCAVKKSTTKSADIQATQNKFRNEWQALEQNDASYYASKGSKNVNALVETRWSQGAGYNNYCPEYSGSYDGHSVTGCVATAMAQIIRYHRYPNVGYSYNSYTHPVYGKLRADFDSAYYDFTKMPVSVNSHSSNANQHAVSLLCYHCGVAVNMNYQSEQHTSGSGAHSEDVPDALKHFGYLDCFFLYKNSNNEIWDSLLKHDLDLARPVYYSGSSSGGGHAFVCDGYSGNGFYHFNFGWGGYGDGDYSLSSVNGYSSRQGAVFNIVPCGMGPMHNPLYIAADGQGTGSSWDSAYPDLNSAMKVCNLYKSSTIWVKNGIYYGDTTADAAFTTFKETIIYGGFRGTESSLDERNLNSGRTVLSGRNQRRVLYSPAKTSEYKIYDITFADGLAETGAGAYIENNIRLERCKFENNHSTADDGAALYSTSGLIYCCVLQNNYGGAAHLNGGYIKNSLIAHNDGYGIFSQGGTIDGCDIVCNNGVGTRNENNTKIRNCVFWHNDSSLTSNDITRITFSAIEGFGDIDSNSNFGISHTNRPENGLGPFFVDPDTTIGPTTNIGDWRISNFSPLVNAGDTTRSGSYVYDLAGGSRFRNGRIDIGCYEQDPNVGIQTPDDYQVVRIYPNPASEIISIETTDGEIEIYDAFGRRVFSANASYGLTVLDISNLPKGIYLLRTNNTTNKFIKK